MVREFTQRAPSVVHRSVKPLHVQSRSQTAHAPPPLVPDDPLLPEVPDEPDVPLVPDVPDEPLLDDPPPSATAPPSDGGSKPVSSPGSCVFDGASAAPPLASLPCALLPRAHAAPPRTRRARAAPMASRCKPPLATGRCRSFRARVARRDRFVAIPAHAALLPAQNGMSTVVAAAGARPKLLPLSDDGANGASAPVPSAWLRVGWFGEWTANATISVL